MAVLIDTNVFLALVFLRDPNHMAAREAFRNLTGERIVAAPVLPELFYLITQRVSYAEAVRFFGMLQGTAFRIEPLTVTDMARMSVIMREYEDNRFDYVDTAIMALSERLNITRVYTLDRRDFSVFRPKHCPALTLFP
ncbi:MAG: type II toxin-antitoxin system VapC family toxin [Aggregatilineales bacterium]